MVKRRSPSHALVLIALVGFCATLLFAVDWKADASPRAAVAKPSLAESVLSARIAQLERELESAYNVSATPTLPRRPCPTAARCPTCHAPSPVLNSRQDATAWLIITIPTVPRRGPDKLSATLLSIADEIKGDDLAIRVVVMNNRPGAHPSFESARQTYASNHQFVFVENASPEQLSPEQPLAEEFASRNQQAPTDAVMRQTLDVISVLTYVANKSTYVLLFEDDFTLCESAALALRHMVQAANRASSINEWSAIRCSFGLAGIILQNGIGSHPDVDEFRNYLKAHVRRRPPDHLAVEFYAKESQHATAYFGRRRVFAFRYNIARHEGHISTLRDEEAWATPNCFDELVAPQVFEVEAWNAKDCPHDDMWPCASSPRARHIQWGHR